MSASQQLLAMASRLESLAGDDLKTAVQLRAYLSVEATRLRNIAQYTVGDIEQRVAQSDEDGAAGE